MVEGKGEGSGQSQSVQGKKRKSFNRNRGSRLVHQEISDEGRKKEGER